MTTIVQGLIIGYIRGLGGPDLERAMTDVPQFIGEEAGKFTLKTILQKWRENPEEAKAELEGFLEQNKSAATDIFIGLLHEFSLEGKISRLETYCRVLNIIGRAPVIMNNKAIILRGFFHSRDCTSLWTPALLRGRNGDIKYSVSRDMILPPSNSAPSIFVIDEVPTDDEIITYNTRIRKGDKEIVGKLIKKGKRVVIIREFEVKDFGEIPDNAPGILELFRTLPLALKGQAIPDDKLRETMSMVYANLPPIAPDKTPGAARTQT